MSYDPTSCPHEVLFRMTPSAPDQLAERALVRQDAFAERLGAMTDLVDIAEFRSTAFAPALPEESQVNPSVYGAELAFWLCKELAKRNVPTSYPEYEDWGWYLEYLPSSGSEFAVHCGNIGGAKDHWLLSLRRHARKLFGRDKPPFSEVSELVSEIQRLLESEPSVTDLKWLYPEESAA